MTKFRLLPSNHYALSGFDFGDIDRSVDEYMQIAARILYDIIREWQEHKTGGQPQTKPRSMERNLRR